MTELGYDGRVKAGFQVLAFVALVGLMAAAQINGVPASVTSLGFGGSHSLTPGVPASVTSLGSMGFQGHSPFAPSTCCINPLFPVNVNPPAAFGHHHHRRDFVPFGFGGAVYATPYTPVVVVEESRDREDDEDYQGGPTIFDRRGPGGFQENHYEARSRAELDGETQAYAPAPSAPAEEITSQPLTVLVYRDGHQLDVQNYAIQGDLLFDLTPGHPRKIALSDLDLDATEKANDDRGLDFRLPNRPGGD